MLLFVGCCLQLDASYLCCVRCVLCVVCFALCVVRCVLSYVACCALVDGGCLLFGV